MSDESVGGKDVIAMTLSVELWRLGCSETSVMSDLIQNIGEISQVVLKLKNYT